MNDLSDNAVSVISKIVDFSGGVLQQAQQIVSDSQAAAANAALHAENLGQTTTQSALATTAQAVNNTQLGQSAIFTNPAFLIAGVVAIGLIVYIATKRRS